MASKFFERIQGITVPANSAKKLIRSTIEGGDRLIFKILPKCWLSSNFVILTSQRTGSNLFVEFLNSHPEIACYSELFSGVRIAFSSSKDYKILDNTILIKLRDFFNRSFLILIWINLGKGKLVGFKLLEHHSHKERNLLLGKKKTKKILLSRKNFVRAELSLHIAKRCVR